VAATALLCLGLLLSPALEPASETHEIKFKQAAKGQVTKVDEQESTESNVVVVDPDDKKIADQKQTTSKVFVYQETTLEKPDGAKRAANLKRSYEKARTKTGDKEETLSFEGKTVLIEKKGDKYCFSIEGGKELDAKEAVVLDAEFNKAADVDMRRLQPDKPVKINESWKLDTDPIIKDLMRGDESITFDAANSEATAKLLEVYEKDGRKYGKIVFHIRLPIKEFNAKEKVKVQPGAKMIMTINLDGCIDGAEDSAHMKMEMKMDGEALIPSPDGKEFKMTMAVRANAEKRGKEQSKK
jgi:hypothetical protein